MLIMKQENQYTLQERKPGTEGKYHLTLNHSIFFTNTKFLQIVFPLPSDLNVCVSVAMTLRVRSAVFATTLSSDWLDDTVLTRGTSDVGVACWKTQLTFELISTSADEMYFFDSQSNDLIMDERSILIA